VGCQEAEKAASRGNMRGACDATRKLCSDRRNKVDTVNTKDGKLLTNEEDVRKDDKGIAQYHSMRSVRWFRVV